MIYFSSDLHFNHNKDFCYAARGFSSVQEMNETVYNNIINIVKPDDDFYILGDVMLGGRESTDDVKNKLQSLPGHIHLIRGNHDTDTRIKFYKENLNWEVLDALNLRYRKWTFFLSHYPMMLSREDYHKYRRNWNLCGHSHTTDRFADMSYGAYHVEVDAHNMTPVSIEEVCEDIKSYITAHPEIEFI